MTHPERRAPTPTPSGPAPAAALADAGADREVEERWQGWDRAVSAALDDEQLARAVGLACATLPPASRVGPPIRAQLIRWAAHTLTQAGGEDLPTALATRLASNHSASVSLRDRGDLPAPPTAAGAGRPLRQRIAALTRTAQRQGAPP